MKTLGDLGDYLDLGLTQDPQALILGSWQEPLKKIE